MPNPLLSLPPFDEHGHVRVVVETPRGASVKIALEGECFVARRGLPVGQCFAYDWGFVPGTCAPDGDPVDAIALHDSGTYPGVVLACRPIGLVRIEQDSPSGERQGNDRLIAIPAWNRRLGHVDNLSALPTHLRAEIEQFFRTVTLFTAKHVRVTGWEDSTAAIEHVRQYVKAY
jgi:inorganic pyrophosphatase